MWLRLEAMAPATSALTSVWRVTDREGSRAPLWGLFCMAGLRARSRVCLDPAQPEVEMLKVGSGHGGRGVVDGLIDDGEQMPPLLFGEGWLRLVMNGVLHGVMNGGFDQRHLTGWQFRDILPGSSSDC